MTTNEIKVTLAEYDGFTHYDTAYLTDLNILHRVAVKVVTEIRKIMDNSDYLDFDLAGVNNTIISAMFDLPINGEYIQLATATAEAIVYLKSHKP
jgi:hypothetical protein